MTAKFDGSEILAFWYAENALKPDGYTTRKELWFQVHEDFDLEIKKRFEPQISQAAADCENNPTTDVRESLARIIALDQFPRNCYRGTPKAFSFDSLALRMTQELINSGRHEQLAFPERIFAYMPLQHAECLETQILSVKMFSLLTELTDDPTFCAAAQDSIVYAQLHKDIIEQFGRFPHRNEILGRESTAQEIAYLQSGAETFGQVKAK